jgi:hypothetical protein
MSDRRGNWIKKFRVSCCSFYGIEEATRIDMRSPMPGRIRRSTRGQEKKQ